MTRHVRLLSFSCAVVSATACGGCMTLQTEAALSRSHGLLVHPFLQTRFIQVNGHRVRYADLEGPGHSPETVILVHGFPETLQAWRKVAPRLARRYRVVVPDMLGAGASAKPVTAYTPARMARFVVGVMDALKIREAHLVGVDTGVMVVGAVAGTRPERVQRVVLAAGSLLPEDVESWEVDLMCTPGIGGVALFNPFLGAVIKMSLRKGFANPRLVSREMYEEYLSGLEASGGRRAALRLIRDLTSSSGYMKDCAARIRAPVLVVYADTDRFFPVAAGRRLAGLLHDARFRVIEDCGHFLQEEKPARFAAQILEFLAPPNAQLEPSGAML